MNPDVMLLERMEAIGERLIAQNDERRHFHSACLRPEAVRASIAHHTKPQFEGGFFASVASRAAA